MRLQRQRTTHRSRTNDWHLGSLVYCVVSFLIAALEDLSSTWKSVLFYCSKHLIVSFMTGSPQERMDIVSIVSICIVYTVASCCNMCTKGIRYVGRYRCAKVFGNFILSRKIRIQKICETGGFILLAETFLHWRRGQMTSINLGISIIAFVSLFIAANILFTRFIEGEWNKGYELLSPKKQDEFKSMCNYMDTWIGVCYFFGILPGLLYFDERIITYLNIAIVLILSYYTALQDDRLLWRIKIDNSIDIDTARKLHRRAQDLWPTLGFAGYKDINDRHERRRNVLEIKYFLCNVLREESWFRGGSQYRVNRRGISSMNILKDASLSRPSNFGIDAVKDLVDLFPGYMAICDRDGSSPLQLACQFTSPTIVQYVIELDDTLLNNLDGKGNTAMHWACRHGNYQVVHYLLRNHMSMVTKANSDGDLPIHLACDYVNENERTASIEEVYRLLLAYPESLNALESE